MKVFITDDHEVIIQGYKVLLKSFGFNIVGASQTGKGLLNWLKENTCDIIILDLSLPDITGIDVLKERIGKKTPKIIVVSGTYDAEQIKQSIILGTKGFVCKNEVHLVLKEALEKVHQGRKYFSESVMDIFINKQLEEDSIVTIENILSPREIETLQLMMQNLESHEICEEMNITKGTLGKIFQRMREKLGVKKNIGLALLALKHKFYKDK